MTHWTDDAIDWYARSYGEDPTTRSVAQAAPVRSGDDVLDVGCGTGATLRHLLQSGHDGRLCGVDPFPRMIEHARAASKDTSIEYAVAGGEDLPFSDGSFDGVLLVNSYQHFDEPAQAMAEVARVTRAGGWLVIGGERFETEFRPESDDFADALNAAGYSAPEVTRIDGGFAAVSRRMT